MRSCLLKGLVKFNDNINNLQILQAFLICNELLARVKILKPQTNKEGVYK